MKRVAGLFLLGTTLCAGLGCSGNVSRGRALYADGYYVEAAEVFERNEARLDEWPPEKRAAYGLYRSMTLLQLGDMTGAERWLNYCHWIQEHSPQALDNAQRELLASTQARLEEQRRQGVPGSGEAVAAQDGQVPGNVAEAPPVLGAPPASPTKRSLVP